MNANDSGNNSDDQNNSECANTAQRWIVCFAPGDYHQFTPSCTTHIMHAFRDHGFSVLWINPIPIGIPGVRSSGGRRRILRRLRSYLTPFRRVRKSFFTVSLAALPATIAGAQAGWNEMLGVVQLKVLSFILRIKQPLVWVETPTARHFVRVFRGQSVYQLSDKFELARYASPATAEKLSENSRALVVSADLVLCTAQKLYRELRSVRKDVQYLPHAVNLTHFSRRMAPPPDDLASLPRPIIGYYGTLSISNDQAILRACAARHPDWSIVLIGRITGGDWSKTRAIPNIHFLGYKSLDLIPLYGTNFDVAIMNWIIDDWMQYVHPLKLREYLALGLPVVSVPIPEVIESYSEIVYVAHSPEDFVTQVEHALIEDCERLAEERRNWVSSHTWETYTTTVIDSLRQLRTHTKE